MGKASFASQVEHMIREGGPRRSTSIVENVVTGCYVIMRKLKSYRLEHFLSDDFFIGQYFLLIELINKEAKELEKAHKDAERKQKSKGRR